MKKISFFTLFLLISFASVNAVLFTPALPEIAKYFGITDAASQQTITFFLIGYAAGQLLYGPIANRYGRKPALYAGIILQIISSLLCVFAGMINEYSLLVTGRFLLALGSGVGLKMTFTLVNETEEPKNASRIISWLMLAFAISPGLGVMIGGILSENFDWTSTFYAGAIYGLILLVLVKKLPETKTELNYDALKLNHLLGSYSKQFKNFQLIVGGLLMGSATSFVYIFAALAPFIAMEILNMNAASYGIANLLPSVGLVIGSLISAKLIHHFHHTSIIRIGMIIALLGSLMMLLFSLTQLSALIVIFIPMMICYLGLAMIFPNASNMAMSATDDKAHGSAVMNFINMGLVTILVLGLQYVQIRTLLLPVTFLAICLLMIIFFGLAKRNQRGGNNFPIK